MRQRDLCHGFRTQRNFVCVCVLFLFAEFECWRESLFDTFSRLTPLLWHLSAQANVRVIWCKMGWLIYCVYTYTQKARQACFVRFTAEAMSFTVQDGEGA